MVFTIRIEQIDDEDDGGLIWEARVDEYPNVREYDKDSPQEAGMLAVDAAVSLRLGH